MAKEYFVLRAGRVLYAPGHYDLEGAERTAREELSTHPKAVVTIVKVVSVLTTPKETKP